MNRTDQRILALLQSDATLTAADIADRIGLSKTSCWRRIANLHSRGIIRRVVALLDPKQLRVSTTVFVTIKTGDHSAAWFERFRKAVEQLPEIIEIHRMSGDVDYLIRIVVPDIAAYDAVYRRLIGSVACQDVSASFALEPIKSTTALPLNYAPLD